MNDDIKHALRVAVEHLASNKCPRQNWGQFLSLIKNTGAFTDEEINRWDNIYKY